MGADWKPRNRLSIEADWKAFKKLTIGAGWKAQNLTRNWSKLGRPKED
jgi:hypothetical protein